MGGGDDAVQGLERHFAIDVDKRSNWEHAHRIAANLSTTESELTHRGDQTAAIWFEGSAVVTVVMYYFSRSARPRGAHGMSARHADGRKPDAEKEREARITWYWLSVVHM